MVSYGAVVANATPAEPALFGILSSATTVVEDNDGHWTRGFQYETTDCSVEVKVSTICNGVVAITAVPPAEGGLYKAYFPFAVQATFECSTLSLAPEEIETRAAEALKLCTQKAIEHEVWTGELAKAAAADYTDDDEYPNRYLASATSVDVTPTPGTPVKTKFGLALLEKALADCGCGARGTIHVTRDAASALGLKEKNGHLETNLGTRVVAGVGYTGSGPTGVIPTGTQTWMYATGPVTVRLGETVITPDEVSQSVNTSVNTIEYYAERVAAVTWDSCCQHAVLVDLSLDYS